MKTLGNPTKMPMTFHWATLIGHTVVSKLLMEHIHSFMFKWSCHTSSHFCKTILHSGQICTYTGTDSWTWIKNPPRLFFIESTRLYRWALRLHFFRSLIWVSVSFFYAHLFLHSVFFCATYFNLPFLYLNIFSWDHNTHCLCGHLGFALNQRASRDTCQCPLQPRQCSLPLDWSLSLHCRLGSVRVPGN